MASRMDAKKFSFFHDNTHNKTTTILKLCRERQRQGLDQSNSTTRRIALSLLQVTTIYSRNLRNTLPGRRLLPMKKCTMHNQAKKKDYWGKYQNSAKTKILYLFKAPVGSCCTSVQSAQVENQRNPTLLLMKSCMFLSHSDYLSNMRRVNPIFPLFPIPNPRGQKGQSILAAYYYISTNLFIRNIRGGLVDSGSGPPTTHQTVHENLLPLYSHIITHTHSS